MSDISSDMGQITVVHSGGVQPAPTLVAHHPIGCVLMRTDVTTARGVLEMQGWAAEENGVNEGTEPGVQGSAASTENRVPRGRVWHDRKYCDMCGLRLGTEEYKREERQKCTTAAETRALFSCSCSASLRC